MYSTTNNNRDVKRKDKDGNAAFAVTEINNFNPPTLADSITAEYPANNIEVYRYRQGGIAGIILSTVTVTYLTNSKKDLESVVVT